KGKNPGLAAAPTPEPWPAPGEKKKLQIVPSEIFLNPGESRAFRIRALDANGYTVDENVDPKSVKWEPFIPPTALVKATMKASFDDQGQLVVDKEPLPSAGQFKGTLGTAVGFFKGRVLPNIPIKQDLET